VLHVETVQDNIVPDPLWLQREILQEKVTQGTLWLKLESTEDVRKGVAKTEHTNVDIHQKMMRTCADSLAFSDEIAKLECPLASNYLTIIKSSTGCKIQRIG
jgi:hypothetical protein